MQKINKGLLKIKNQDTGKFEGFPILVGKSAYDIALEHGFQGSETEFGELLANRSSVEVDFELSLTSESPVQNKVVTAKFDELSEAIDNLQVPTKVSQLTNDKGYATEEYVDGEIDSLKAQGVQQVPLYVNSIEECVDKTKVYVLPDGYIYGLKKVTEEVEGEPVANFTNIKDQCYFKYQQRYSLSGGGYKAATYPTYRCATIIVPVPSGVTSLTIYLQGCECNSDYTAMYTGTGTDNFSGVDTLFSGSWDAQCKTGDKSFTIPVTKSVGTTGVLFHLEGYQESDFADLIVTVDEPIEYTTKNEIVTVEKFVNTGHAFVPADYEDRIIELEDNAEITIDNTNRIIELENKIGTVDENAVIHSAIGTTYPPSQKPADSDFEGYDIDLYSIKSNELYAYIDEVVANKETVTKEVLGKDASGKYDIVRYIFANREYLAWQKVNYPRMYAWKNGTTIIYSTSVSPRVGDTMYSTHYIGTSKGTVSTVNATNRSRTVGGVEYVRYESGDIKPTVIYTDKDDERNSNTSITKDGVTYNRYQLGDLGANRTKLIPIFIYANEHGVCPSDLYFGSESQMCALILSRFFRDIASNKQMKNPLYKFIRENCMLIIIPIANPFGFNMHLTGDTNASKNGYQNCNNVNINRNYDTKGWDVTKANESYWAGAYAGSENETQYIMNTMVESGAVVAMSWHSAEWWYNSHQGQNPNPNATSEDDKYVDYNREKLDKIEKFIKTNYGYNQRYYDLYTQEDIDAGIVSSDMLYKPYPCKNTPDKTSKSPSYISQCGAYGGIVEFSPGDIDVGGTLTHIMSAKTLENAYAFVMNLTAMWLSDYLENN